MVNSTGTDTANGTALKNAMDAISGSNTTPTVVQLAAGIYDMGVNTHTMKPHVTLRGLGRKVTRITGAATILVQAGDEAVMRDLRLSSSASGVTLMRLQSGVFMDCYRMDFELGQSGGGSGTSLRVQGGSEIDLTLCSFSGDTNNNGGSRTAIWVSGSGSAAYIQQCLLDMIEESQTGALTAILTASGAEVDLYNSDILMERDTASANGSDVTALSVGSGSRIITKNCSVRATINDACGSSFGIVVTKGASAGALSGFATLYEGDFLPNTSEYYTDNYNQLTLSQCSVNFTDL
ncbi:MAG: hypothetical protein VCD00_14090 [Candidatus Hydrogenedentota bacterium]